MKGALGHRVTESRQPDGVNPDLPRMSHHDHTRFAYPGKPAVEQNELRLRIRFNQIDKQHRVRSLNAGLSGVNLEGQVVLRAQLDQSPHDEVLEILSLLRLELVAGKAEGFPGAFLRNVL